MFEEFVLGHHPTAMCQEVGEHLQGFAPELNGHPRTMQLSALGVQDIVAKEIAHRPVSPLTVEILWPQDTPWMAPPHRLSASFPEAS